jgi:hypothetical protein
MANTEPMHVYPSPDGGQNLILPSPPSPPDTADPSTEPGAEETTTSSPAALADSEQPSA